MRTAKKGSLKLVAPAAPENAAPAPAPANSPANASASNSRFEVVFDQASDAIVTVLPDGRIDAVNQAFEEMTGYLRPELLGRGIDLLVPPSNQRFQHRTRPLSVELLREPGTYEDVAIYRKDSYIRFVDVVVRVVDREDRRAGEGGRFAIALFRDVTEKKRMERELITKHTELRNAYYQLEKKNAELQAMQETLVQSGKMAALGELATGIAHELNQPLQGIRGYAQEIQSLTRGELEKLAHGNEVTASLREVIGNVDKMVNIIQYLRTFVRKSTENHEFTDIHHSIDEALKMLDRQFASRGIAVERAYAKAMLKVYANPISVEQVFINLATNARDAIESTGRGRGTIWISTRDAGDFIEVTFRDDGCGMTEKTKSKAFNPFFTTKEVGKGMGLGLSLSYGILNKLHGSIVVESELGKGAAFLVRLPKDFRELA